MESCDNEISHIHSQSTENSCRECRG